jgi:hypothetical protein
LSGLASRIAGSSRNPRGGTLRTRSLRRECLQTFARTDDYGRLLIVHAASVRMPGHAKVLVRTPPILVTDVAFAHIARHHEDFFGGAKNSRPAPCHRVLSCPQWTGPKFRNDSGNCPFHDRRTGRRVRAKAGKPKDDEPFRTLHELCGSRRAFGPAHQRPCANVAFPDQKAQVR